MAALLAALSAGPSGAQSLDGTTVDSIVGSDVRQERSSVSASEDKVLAAMDRAAEAAAQVRKVSNVDQVDIVLLGDVTSRGGKLPPRIAAKLNERQGQVAELRKEVEANALLFHAVDSRNVLVDDVLAVDFPDPKTIVVYATAKPGG